MAAVSAVAAAVSDPGTWRAADIDSILLQGDVVHCERLAELGWPSVRVTKELAVDELPDTIVFRHCSVNVRASICTSNDQEYFLSHNIQHNLSNIIAGSQYRSTIVRLNDASYGIHKSTLSCHIYLFDSHAVEQKFAGLLRFDSAHELAAYLAHKVKGRRPQQIDCVPIQVQVDAVIDVT